jgi:hypothetical protein
MSACAKSPPAARAQRACVRCEASTPRGRCRATRPADEPVTLCLLRSISSTYAHGERIPVGPAQQAPDRVRRRDRCADAGATGRHPYRSRCPGHRHSRVACLLSGVPMPGFTRPVRLPTPSPAARPGNEPASAVATPPTTPSVSSSRAVVASPTHAVPTPVAAVAVLVVATLLLAIAGYTHGHHGGGPHTPVRGPAERAGVPPAVRSGGPLLEAQSRRAGPGYRTEPSR